MWIFFVINQHKVAHSSKVKSKVWFSKCCATENLESVDCAQSRGQQLTIILAMDYSFDYSDGYGNQIF